MRKAENVSQKENNAHPSHLVLFITDSQPQNQRKRKDISPNGGTNVTQQ
jgi:hypothetical protein